MPPDNHADFDLHLVQGIRNLRDLRKDLSAGNGKFFCLIWGVTAQSGIMQSRWPVCLGCYSPVNSTAVMLTCLFRVLQPSQQYCSHVDLFVWGVTAQSTVLQSCWPVCFGCYSPVNSIAVMLTCLFGVLQPSQQYCSHVDLFVWCVTAQSTVLQSLWPVCLGCYSPVNSIAVMLTCSFGVLQPSQQYCSHVDLFIWGVTAQSRIMQSCWPVCLGCYSPVNSTAVMLTCLFGVLQPSQQYCSHVDLFVWGVTAQSTVLQSCWPVCLGCYSPVKDNAVMLTPL